MPKFGKYFDDQLMISCETELKEKLLALAYLRGDAGTYAPIARVLLRRAAEDAVAALDPDEMKDYKKILDNVRTKALVSRMERQERTRAKLKKSKEAAAPQEEL